MKHLRPYFLVLTCMFALSANTFGQRENLTFKKTLEKFKEHGAMVISPDTGMIRMFKEEITFGKIYGKTESDPKTFPGVFVVEYSNMSTGYSYWSNMPEYVGFFLAINEQYIKPTEHPKRMRESQFLAALRVPNEMREKLPIYVSVLNGLIQLTYEQDKDISVLPGKNLNIINEALGKRVAKIKDKELLVMEYEAAKDIINDAGGNKYLFKYTIKDMLDVVRAYNEREPGKALIITNIVDDFVGKYVVDCETHELLFGRQYESRSKYVHAVDLNWINDAIKNAQ